MSDVLSLFDLPPTQTWAQPVAAAQEPAGFTPRPYQTDLVKQIEAAWQSGIRSVMLQLPTGGGKTVIAGNLLANQPTHLAHAWLTHRDVLRTQSAASLSRWHLPTFDMAAVPASGRRWLTGHVNIISTAVRSIPTLDGNAGLMVVDEAHHTPAKTWASKLRNWPGRVIGVTGTPWRLSPYQGFQDLFDTLICGPSVQDLTDMVPRSLAEADVVYPTGGLRMDRDRLERNSMGEISSASAAAEQERLLHLVSAADWHHDTILAAGLNPERTRTLWFCATVAAAHDLAEHLTAAGEPAAAVDADTPTMMRRDIISRLAAGELSHVTNYEIFTEGLDVPAIDVAVMLRPTESVALHLQMIGRVLRPPGPVLVLDPAGNCVRHGLHTQPRTWSLRPRAETDDREKGEPWTAECPWDDCGWMMPTAVRRCRGCKQPTGKECTGCRRWRRLEHYDPSQTLDAAACVECVAAANKPARGAGSRLAARDDLIDRLRNDETVGAWYLSKNGNPTLRRTTENGIEWTVITRKGMIIRSRPGGDGKDWTPLGAASDELIEKLGGMSEARQNEARQNEAADADREHWARAAWQFG